MDLICHMKQRVLISHNHTKLDKWFLNYFFINFILLLILLFPYLGNEFPLQIYNFQKGEFLEVSYFIRMLVTVYLIISYLSYAAALSFLGIFPALLLSCFNIRARYIMLTAILMISFISLIILIDLYVFYLYRFHINSMIIEMMMSRHRQDIFYFSGHEWTFFTMVCAGILLFQIFFASLAWRYGEIRLITAIKKIGKTMAACFVLSIITTISTFLMGNSYFVQGTSVLPFYSDVTRYLAGINPWQMNMIQSSMLRSKSKFASSPLQYPLNNLHCTPEKPPNIFVILIDTWRYDTMSAITTPKLHKFAKENLNFSSHFSGGNATQPGVFSLFYSLPGTYWTSILEQGQSPVLLQQLKREKYDFAILSSSSLEIPDFASTIFNGLPDLSVSTPGNSSYVRDLFITEKMLYTIQIHDQKKPLFGFIFYDSLHNYCQKHLFNLPFQPALKKCKRFNLLNRDYDAVPLKNRYYNAAYFLDGEVDKILQAIKQAGLWDNSIIIISSDHGEQFNDNYLNYWGHSSNFTKYQLQVPLMIHWPGKTPANYTHQTTHYDIVPTLMKDIFQCHNSPGDYSYGTSLFDKKSRYPIIVANNYTSGYLTPNKIITIYPSGFFQIQNPKGEVLPDKKPDKKRFMNFLSDLKRFYRH